VIQYGMLVPVSVGNSVYLLTQFTCCFYSAADRGAEYCDERVCLSVCLSVRRDHIFATACPIFTNVSRTLPMAVARSCSGGLVIGSTLEYVQRPFDRDYTRVGRYQKGKTSLDFTEARDSEWQRHQLSHMQVCTSLQTDNNASTPPLRFFTGQLSFLPPNQQRQSTEGKDPIQ